MEETWSSISAVAKAENSVTTMFAGITEDTSLNAANSHEKAQPMVKLQFISFVLLMIKEILLTQGSIKMTKIYFGNGIANQNHLINLINLINLITTQIQYNLILHLHLSQIRIQHQNRLHHHHHHNLQTTHLMTQ